MEKFPDAHAIVSQHLPIETPLKIERCDLERAHGKAYLDSVNFDATEASAIGLSSYDRNRLGLPARPNLLQRSSLETAGTLSATLAALEDGCAANLAGGTHHAFPQRGLGFCVLNDVAVAIEYLRARHRKPAQILIVDTDAHQGNGNHAYFREEPSVYTYSIHVGKNYPAHKEPGDCDVPLPRYVSGEEYLETLSKSLEPVFQQTEPDLVYWISGADIHEDDRFGQMQLSDAHIAERDHIVLKLCRNYACPTVTVYGGGYNRSRGKTGAIHAESILRAASILSTQISR